MTSERARLYKINLYLGFMEENTAGYHYSFISE
jgi:hypothetical protein